MHYWFMVLCHHIVCFLKKKKKKKKSRIVWKWAGVKSKAQSIKRKKEMQACVKSVAIVVTESLWLETWGLRLREAKSEDGKVHGVAASDNVRLFLRCLLRRWKMLSLQCRRGILFFFFLSLSLSVRKIYFLYFSWLDNLCLHNLHIPILSSSRSIFFQPSIASLTLFLYYIIIMRSDLRAKLFCRMS